MTNSTRRSPLGELIDDSTLLSLADLGQACGVPDSLLIEMIDVGLIEPRGVSRATWQFSAVQISRVRRAGRLQRSLGLNMAGAALAIELLEEIDSLRARLQQLERQENQHE